jgi:hypothetical protein
MPSYLVETFLARAASAACRDLERRASSAAAALTREGTRVRFGGLIHVPDDEICFFTFVAETDRDAALAAQRAGLQPLRVAMAISSQEGDTQGCAIDC